MRSTNNIHKERKATCTAELWRSVEQMQHRSGNYRISYTLPINRVSQLTDNKGWVLTPPTFVTCTESAISQGIRGWLSVHLHPICGTQVSGRRTIITRYYLRPGSQKSASESIDVCVRSTIFSGRRPLSSDIAKNYIGPLPIMI